MPISPMLGRSHIHSIHARTSMHYPLRHSACSRSHILNLKKKKNTNNRDQSPVGRAAWDILEPQPSLPSGNLRRKLRETKLFFGECGILIGCNGWALSSKNKGERI
jgi:hypothetical protein